MSDNLITNFSKNNTEHFQQFPAYSLGNVSNKEQSFSALNRDKKNLHNSIYSDLPDGRKDMIIKNGFKFKNLNKIDPYFYNENVGHLPGCISECKNLKVGNPKRNPCAAFEFDKSDKSCTLYNTVPNSFVSDPSMISGYKNNHKLNFSELSQGQIENVQNRIGSHYVQKKQGIINTSSIHNLNKCIKAYRGTLVLRTFLYFSIGGNRWDGTYRFMSVYLAYNGTPVTEKVTFENEEKELFRNTINKREINFSMKSTKANEIYISVGNDGITLENVKIALNLGDVEQEIMTVPVNSWIKRRTRKYKLPNVLDIENLKVTAVGKKKYNGTSREINLKFSPIKNRELDNILKKNFFRIQCVYTVNQNHNNWRNLFHYGNTNIERAPAAWLTPNNPWKIHIAFRTNYRNNHYVNVDVPNEVRQYNIKTTMNIDFIQYINEDNNKPGFMISCSFNGIWVKTINYGTVDFIRLPGRNFHIKDPWYDKNNYTVHNVNFSSVPLELLTTGRGRGNYEDSTRFNELVSNLKPPFYIIRVGYSGYYSRSSTNENFEDYDDNDDNEDFDDNEDSDVIEDFRRRRKFKFKFKKRAKKIGKLFSKKKSNKQNSGQTQVTNYGDDYQYIIYKRLTDCTGIDMWSLFHTDWFSPNRGVKNLLNKDFELYNNLTDAINGTSKWKFCNYDDPGIGMPRDCGRTRGIGNQWQSKTRGGKITWALYLYNAQGAYLNLNLQNSLITKVKGWQADPACVYRNISEPNEAYIRNLKPITDKNNADNQSKPNDDLLQKNIQDYKTDMNTLGDFLNDYDNVQPDEKLSLDYARENHNLKKKNKEPKDNIADIKGLVKSIGKSSVLETFDNKCTTNIYNLIYMLIVFLILFYILFYN